MSQNTNRNAGWKNCPGWWQMFLEGLLAELVCGVLICEHGRLLDVTGDDG